MLRKLLTNGVLLGLMFFAAVYTVARSLFAPDVLIVLLNGMFVGAGICFLIAFYRLIFDAVRGAGPYDRVRQMALSMSVIWAAVSIGIFTSVYGRAIGIYTSTPEATPIARYIAIVGGVLQVSAPDVGLPLFASRDRKLLLVAIAAGIVVAIVVIALQT